MIQAISPQQSSRFLQQAQFSATMPEIEYMQKIDSSKWIDEQLAMPINQTGFDWIKQGKYEFGEKTTNTN